MLGDLFPAPVDQTPAGDPDSNGGGHPCAWGKTVIALAPTAEIAPAFAEKFQAIRAPTVEVAQAPTVRSLTVPVSTEGVLLAPAVPAPTAVMVLGPLMKSCAAFDSRSRRCPTTCFEGKFHSKMASDDDSFPPELG